MKLWIAICFCLGVQWSLGAISLEEIQTFQEALVQETRAQIQGEGGAQEPPSQDLEPEEPTPEPTFCFPPPKPGYAPLVIVNDTGLSPHRVYFVAKGTSASGSEHFLKASRSSGICSYASPKISNSTDKNISLRLSSLPSCSEGVYYVYIPEQTRGMGFISIDRPLYLKTSHTSIESPNVGSLRDPNYYTMHQSFTLNFNVQEGYSAEVCYEDQFALPLTLESFSSPGRVPYETQSGGYVSSGFVKGVCSKQVFAYMQEAFEEQENALLDCQWRHLMVPFYADPYEDADYSCHLRVLSPAKSLELNGETFVDAAHKQKNFCAAYLQRKTTGPIPGSSFMQSLVKTVVSKGRIPFIIYPSPLTPVLYELMAHSEEVLECKAMVPSAPSMRIDLSRLSTFDFLSGDIEKWDASGAVFPGGVNVHYKEIAKLFSGLYSLGQLPPSSLLDVPFEASPQYFAKYTDLYYKNPEEFSSGGLWYDFYSASLRSLMIQVGGIGRARLGPLDRWLGLSGSLEIPYVAVGSSKDKSPYLELTIGKLGMEPPKAQSSYGPYRLKVNPLSSTAGPVQILFKPGPDATSKMKQWATQDEKPLIIERVYGSFELEFTFLDESPLRFEVFPRHQLVVPRGKKYTQRESKIMEGIEFSEVDGSLGEYTLTLPNT